MTETKVYIKVYDYLNIKIVNHNFYFIFIKHFKVTIFI